MLIDIIDKNTLVQNVYDEYKLRYEIYLDKYYDNNDELYTIDDFNKYHDLETKVTMVLDLYCYLQSHDMIDCKWLRNDFLKVHDNQTYKIIIECYNDNTIIVGIADKCDNSIIYFSVKVANDTFIECLKDQDKLINGCIYKKFISFFNII